MGTTPHHNTIFRAQKRDGLLGSNSQFSGCIGAQFLTHTHLETRISQFCFVAWPQVDINNMSGQQQSSEDMYWQTLWNATKDLCHSQRAMAHIAPWIPKTR